jgi:hypothetical protein
MRSINEIGDPGIIYYDVPFSQNKNIPQTLPADPGVETTTWHDQSPSHPPVNPAIADMEAKLADYIARADNLLDKWMDDQTGTITWYEVNTATERATLCQNALYYLRELKYGNDCTCQPNDVSICRFCYLSKQYTQFMEQCSEPEQEN